MDATWTHLPLRYLRPASATLVPRLNSRFDSFAQGHFDRARDGDQAKDLPIIEQRAPLLQCQLPSETCSASVKTRTILIDQTRRGVLIKVQSACMDTTIDMELFDLNAVSD